MARDFTYKSPRFWPSVATALAGALLAAALAGRSEAGTVAAGLAVAGSAAFARLAYRADRGWRVQPLAQLAAAAVGLLGLLLLVLAGRSVLVPVVAAVAGLALLALAVTAAVLEVLARTSPPGWLCGPDGGPLPRRERYLLAGREVSARLQQRRRRPPHRVFRRIDEDLREAMRAAAARGTPVPTCFHAAVHPDTLARLAAWKELPQVADLLAARYAVVAEHALPRGAEVCVGIHTDDLLPVGAAVVVAAPDAVPLAPMARGSARVGCVGQRPVGDPDGGGADDRPGSPGRRDSGGDSRRDRSGGTGWEHDSDARTRVAVLPDPTPEQVTGAAQQPGSGATAGVPRRAVLVLRRVEPDARSVPGAGDYLLDGSREWWVGRRAGADIRIDVPHVSRGHLRLLQRNDRWFAVDESNSGTTRNGMPMAPGAETELQAGDVLELGRPLSSPHRVLLQVA